MVSLQVIKHLKQFNAWVWRVFRNYEWSPISSACLPRTGLNFPWILNLMFSFALTYNFDHVTHHVTKKWEFRKSAVWRRIFFIKITELVFPKQILNENDDYSRKWRRHTRKKEIRVLLSGVEPKTFRLLVRMLYHWATGDSWELRPLN